MTTLHTLRPAHPRTPSRTPATAALLRAAGRLLEALASRLEHADARRGPASAADAARLEFHAEAGAPEGALYVDGELVGWLPGVSRL